MKTAKQLGITAAERRALPKIRDGLREGRYRHVKRPEMAEKKGTKPVFNMNTMCSTFDCGQVGCIGGWVAFEMKMNVEESANYVDEATGPIQSLFYPPDNITDWDNITPKRAATAIDNFLNGNEPWKRRAA